MLKLWIIDFKVRLTQAIRGLVKDACADGLDVQHAAKSPKRARHEVGALVSEILLWDSHP